MRVLVAGDWHGNTAFVDALYDRWVATLDVQAVFQVGDFGYWPNLAGECPFLDVVSGNTSVLGIPTYFIDGNHENHEKLQEQVTDFNDFCEVRDNLFYVPRGKTWEWDGVKCMGFGGAYSVDKARRTPYINWFPQEMPTGFEMDRAKANGEVDILFSHDVPTGVQEINYRFAGMGPIEGAEWSRKHLREVADNARPKMLIHGHYHFPYREQWSAPWGMVKVQCLDSDYTSASWSDHFIVLDTEHPT